MAPNDDPIRPRPTAAAAYAAVLAEQLRQTGMREEQVRVVVADVLDHVHATQEDPVTAFGQPADYAAQWARPLGPGRIGLRVLAAALGSAGFFAMVFGVLGGGDWTRDVDIDGGDVTVAGGVALITSVLPWTVDLWLSRRAARRFGTGRDVPTTLVRVVAAMGFLGGLVLVGERLGWMSSDVPVFSVPRWALAAGGVLAAPLLFVVREPRSPSLPRDPGRPATGWGRLRDRVLGNPPRGPR